MDPGSTAACVVGWGADCVGAGTGSTGVTSPATGVTRRPNASGAGVALKAAGLIVVPEGSAPNGSFCTATFVAVLPAPIVNAPVLRAVVNGAILDWIWSAIRAGGTAGTAPTGYEFEADSGVEPCTTGMGALGPVLAPEAPAQAVVSEATLPAEVNIERIIASASCDAETGDAIGCDGSGGMNVPVDCVSLLASLLASLAATALAATALGATASEAALAAALAFGDPSSKFTRLTKPSGGDGIAGVNVRAIAAGAAFPIRSDGSGFPRSRIGVIWPKSPAAPAGCVFVVAATPFTFRANAVPSPKWIDANSSD
jgi:hypothetical protein